MGGVSRIGPVARLPGSKHGIVAAPTRGGEGRKKKGGQARIERGGLADPRPEATLTAVRPALRPLRAAGADFTDRACLREGAVSR